MTEQPSLFTNYDFVFTYTRAQAIADGVLIDVTKTAREAGIRFPVAVTANLWHGYIVPREPSHLSCQSIEGRLWDTLFLFHFAAREHEGDTLFFEVSYVMRGRAQKMVKLKSVCGPGDTPEPVITIMLPFED
jgi:hypothetical protein